MDLRVKKTEKAIRSAFYELLQEKPIEKITVRELSEKAVINKTTFYAHYDTIYDLVNTLEQETIDSIMEHLDECNLIFTDPEAFVYNLYTAMKRYPNINLACSSSNSTRFAEKLNKTIQEEVIRKNIKIDQYDELSSLLVFLLNGIIGLQRSKNTNSLTSDIKYIAKFVKGGMDAIALNKTPNGVE